MADKSKTVLVVDDEDDFRHLMNFWLKSEGYDVLVENSGKGAIAAVKEKNPDIALIDIRMPHMDGVETIKEIRAFDQEIPIIIISAYVSDPIITEAMKYGISGIFYKGTDFKDGLSLLQAALRTHKKLK